MTEQQHHVAWKDRLGLNEQWMRDIMACSANYGSDDYLTAVSRFRDDIVNIKDGPQLRDIIDRYVDTTLYRMEEEEMRKWIQMFPNEAKIQEEREAQKFEIRREHARQLYKFMIQLLEDNGFGFYKSDMTIDEISLTKNHVDDGGYTEEI